VRFDRLLYAWQFLIIQMVNSFFMLLKFWYSYESVSFFKYVTAEKRFRTACLRKFSVCGGNLCVAVTQFLISKM
jgi:hypothetical protein